MKHLIYPQPLSVGDRVRIVSPSGKIEHSLLLGAKQHLELWGLRVELSPHAGATRGRYAGTIAQRLQDLQDAMDDDGLSAIFCSRGGYGAVHLVEALDFTGFARHPKWLIGFSDITALHNTLQAHGFASLHAPMARHLTEEPDGNMATSCLHQVLFAHTSDGTDMTYTCPRSRYDVKGTCQGVLRGGNLAVLYGLRGTRFDIPAEGTVLFIEDVGERPHAIERMIYNLRIGGILPRLSGLVVGQFTEFEDNRALGKELYAAIADLVKDYGYPVAFDFPVGHTPDNMPLICGAPVTLDVGKKRKTLSFPVKIEP